MSLKGRSLYRAMIKRGFSMLMSQVLWKEGAIRSNTDQRAKGCGGQSRRVEGQGSGSRQVLYTWRPPRKGTLDPDSDLRVEEKPAGGGAFQSVDSGSRAHGKPEMGEGG